MVDKAQARGYEVSRPGIAVGYSSWNKTTNGGLHYLNRHGSQYQYHVVCFMTTVPWKY